MTFTGMPTYSESVRPLGGRRELADAAVRGGIGGDDLELVKGDSADEGKRPSTSRRPTPARACLPQRASPTAEPGHTRCAREHPRAVGAGGFEPP